jgi:hypothetical protein
MNERKMILTEEEIRRIRKATDWGRNTQFSNYVTLSEPLKICNCKAEKILTKVAPRGPGFPELIIEIMCMACGSRFEGFVVDRKDVDFFYQRVEEIKEIT